MDKSMELLEALAIQLGVTAEYMWPKLVEYTFMLNLIQFIAGCIGLLLLVTALPYACFKIKKIEREDNRAFGYALTIVLAILILILATAAVVDSLPGLFVPEAAALKYILGTM